jgi:hypothetical protein
MLSKLALTVDDCQSSIRKLQRERGTMNLEGLANSSIVVDGDRTADSIVLDKKSMSA